MFYVPHFGKIRLLRNKITRIIYLTHFPLCWLGHMKNCWMKESLTIRSRCISWREKNKKLQKKRGRWKLGKRPWWRPWEGSWRSNQHELKMIVNKQGKLRIRRPAIFMEGQATLRRITRRRFLSLRRRFR